MFEIKPKKIIKFTSENESFLAQNLLKGSNLYPWKCKNGEEKESSIEFEFNGSVNITKIEVGNCGSASVDISVAEDMENDYKSLVLSTALMSTREAIKGENLNKIRSFNESDFIGQTRHKLVKRLRVVCSQPFNKSFSYGLSYIKFFSFPSTENTLCQESIKHKLNINIAMKNEECHNGSPFSFERAALKEESSMKEVIRNINQNMTGNKDDNEKNAESQHNLNKKKSGEKIEKNEEIKENLKKENNLNQSTSSMIQNEIKTKEFVKKAESVCVPLQSHFSGVASEKVLAGVSFVLSGYQNPLRNTLRDHGISLGARYRPSWTKDCTHLICAFANTPKYREVLGHGIIVSDKWIMDCYMQKKHLPWQQYSLTGVPEPVLNVGESTSVTSHPELKRSYDNGDDDGNSKRRRIRTVCDADECDTDDEIENVARSDGDILSSKELCLPTLPVIFMDLVFFFYGANFEYEERRKLTRIIYAFGGLVSDYMGSAVTTVLTRCPWGDVFEEALVDHGDRIVFVNPAWVYKCDEVGSLCPLNTFEVTREESVSL